MSTAALKAIASELRSTGVRCRVVTAATAGVRVPALAKWQHRSINGQSVWTWQLGNAVNVSRQPYTVTIAEVPYQGLTWYIVKVGITGPTLQDVKVNVLTRVGNLEPYDKNNAKNPNDILFSSETGAYKALKKFVTQSSFFKNAAKATESEATAAARADSPHRPVTLASHEYATSILRSHFGAKKVQTELRKVLARTLAGVTLTVSKPRGAKSLQIKLSRHGAGADSSSAVLDTLGPDYLIVSVDGKPPRRIDYSVAIAGAVRLAISLLK